MKKDLNYICKLENCTGCTACYNACPSGAIKMVENKEGFLYPQIDAIKCINCGKCKIVCPDNTGKQFNTGEQKAYGAYADDEILLNKSSSGGVFTVIAEYILKQNGVVCGAAYNSNMEVEHIIVDNSEDLIKLRGSKYLQSKLGNVFKNIKTYLEQGRPVLFTGTPCQAAGLKNFLNKDYDNLLIIDLICHGVPPYKLFRKYLDENYRGEKIIDVNFRDKRDGWGNNYNVMSLKTENKIFTNNSDKNDYYRSFFANMSLRKSCSDCKYSRIKRVGDITIADFWGVPKKYKNKNGISLVLINNEKARLVFEKIKNNFQFLKEFPVDIIRKGLPHLNAPPAPHPSRDEFMGDVNNMSIKEAMDKNFCSKKNVAILNYHWENVNFGAVLTAFALNKKINDAGYNAQNINYPLRQPYVSQEPENKYFDDFRKKYIPETVKLNNFEELKTLNKTFHNFVVGSDQVFRPWHIQFDIDAFLFSFADADKNILSYAASFGMKMEKSNSKQDRIFQLLLSNFDSLSLRELNGVEYCKSLGIKNPVQSIDPVFLLDKTMWENLFNDKKDIHTKIVFYTIDSKIKNEIINFIKTNPAINTGNVKDVTFNTPVEEWLAEINNCDLFITDSFHGICFAIIFNKPFICINKNKVTMERMESLLEMFGIKNRLYDSFENINVEKIVNDKIDYQRVNEIIKIKREEGIEYLKKSLENTVSKEKQEEKIKNLKLYFSLQKKLYNKSYIKYLLRHTRYKLMYNLFRKEKYFEKMNNRKYLYKIYKNNKKYCSGAIKHLQNL